MIPIKIIFNFKKAAIQEETNKWVKLNKYIQNPIIS